MIRNTISARFPRRARGFTFLEALVVMAITILLASIVIPGVLRDEEAEAAEDALHLKPAKPMTDAAVVPSVRASDPLRPEIDPAAPDLDGALPDSGGQ